MKIVVIKWPNNDLRPLYKAYHENSPGKWGCGHSPCEAIGDLILSWKEEFNIDIELKQI